MKCFHEFTPELFNPASVRDILLKGKDFDRTELSYAAISLLIHHNRSISEFERSLNGPYSFRIQHEYSRGDLLATEVFSHQDFVKSRFKGAKFSHGTFNKKKLILTKTLDKKISKLYQGFFTSEIVARSVNSSTGKLERPEYLDYEFCGKVCHYDDIDNKKGVLCIPDWRVFIEYQEDRECPLIARDYPHPGKHDILYNKKFDENDSGTVVFAKSKKVGEELMGRNKMHDDLLHDIEPEIHIPVSLKLLNRDYGFF